MEYFFRRSSEAPLPDGTYFLEAYRDNEIWCQVALSNYPKKVGVIQLPEGREFRITKKNVFTFKHSIFLDGELIGTFKNRELSFGGCKLKVCKRFFIYSSDLRVSSLDVQESYWNDDKQIVLRWSFGDAAFELPILALACIFPQSRDWLA